MYYTDHPLHAEMKPLTMTAAPYGPTRLPADAEDMAITWDEFLSLETSAGSRRPALRHRRTITLIAIPGILACLAAIAYLVLGNS